jgi:membrane-bound metal-dependent hydrolase YbcI (DUF457 family)
MPFAFPSHQGLVAPLWRRWPHLFDVPAMCIGAAMPDVIDGIVGAMRGHLGQGIGHSIWGIVLLCVPVGIPIWYGLHWLARRVALSRSTGFWARSWNLGIEAIRTAPSSFRSHWRLVVLGLLVGSFFHVFFDFISHGGFPWFWPWLRMKPFPDFWYITWFRFPLPGYKNPYPIGVHFLAWSFFSLLGAWLLFRPAFSKKRIETKE